ncbi:hypothetical protein [Mycobacteroides salmoniphilum]|uniref:hypothetical protein n=1 Tax=Mycobacteroides salmoniphilum TaxID=404941 RepID=UPI00177D26F5|nr:hypothetical protein [Mycobacteroides salmoniphilum]
MTLRNTALSQSASGDYRYYALACPSMGPLSAACPGLYLSTGRGASFSVFRWSYL